MPAHASTPARFRPAAAAVLAAALWSPLAGSALTNPPIHMAPQGVEFMCGGRNGAELDFMRMVAPRWGGAFEFSLGQGLRAPFPVPVRVVVRERTSGDTVLEAAADAPMLLARLDPGSYDVEATLGSLTLLQGITVIAGQSARAVFAWPSNFDLASVMVPRQQLAQKPTD